MQVGPNFGDDCYFRECDGEAADTAVAASLWVKGENTERVIIRNFVGSGNGYWEVDLGQCTGWERLTSAHPAVTETNPWGTGTNASGRAGFQVLRIDVATTPLFHMWGRQIEIGASFPSNYIAGGFATVVVN